jgi:CheY-like chemotaxis protein
MKRILLVEDNADTRAIVRVYPEHVGYGVIEAHDGEEAILSASEESSDQISRVGASSIRGRGCDHPRIPVTPFGPAART